MRLPFLTCFLFAAVAGPAVAYENYIPLGTGYSGTVSALPEFGSDEGRIAETSDVYETEIYLKGRKRAEEDSRLRQFFSDRDSNSIDGHLDY